MRACARGRIPLPPSITTQLQSLVASSTSHKLRLTIDLFGCSTTARLPLHGFLPHPPRRWKVLWHPSPPFSLPCASLALSSHSAGVFVGPSRPPSPLGPQPHSHWLDLLQPVSLWCVSIPSLHLTAAFFDAGSTRGLPFNGRRVRGHHPSGFPLVPITWFDALPFPGGVPPPFPLLQEHVVAAGPEPPPASLPECLDRSGRVTRPPAWLAPGLPPSNVPFPVHSPSSPLLGAFRRLLTRHPFASRGLEDLFLHCMAHGFGHVSPTGCSSHRSDPPNSAKSLPHQGILRDNFAKLAGASPPLAYGPFLDRPPFPRKEGGPQAITSALSVAFKGETWASLDKHIAPSDKLDPDYPKSVGLGAARAIQNGSSPKLDPRRPSRGARWSLNDRLHFPSLRQVFASARTIAELLAFFGPGTIVIQTDFPAAYKNCRLPLSSLFAHVSKTTTLRGGSWVVEYWVDAAQIFGSGHAPVLWELFVIVFEHLARSSHALLSLTIHYVDNLFTFLPPWLLGSHPAATAAKASNLLLGFFESLPQPHHDDHLGTSFPALGHYFHSLPSPSVGLKPARVPIVRALLRLISSGRAVVPKLAIAARGMFTWLATIIPAIAFAIPRFIAFERAAKRALASHSPFVDVPPVASHVASIALLSHSLLELGSTSTSAAAVTPLRTSAILSPFASIGAVLRCDASPHFGCGGYSLTDRTYFHSKWNHEPHSPAALSISSTLAEAIGALTVVLLGAKPGITVVQTDSDNLALLVRAGYSSECHLTNEALALMFSHASNIGASLHFVHMLRAFNGAADRLAADAPFKSVVAPLISSETGLSLPVVLSSYTRVQTRSAQATLDSLHSRASITHSLRSLSPHEPLP